MRVLWHRLLPHEFGLRYVHFFLFLMEGLLFGVLLFGEEVEDVLFAFGPAEQIGGVDIFHLVFVESCDFHFHWIFALFLLERPSCFLLKLYSYWLWVREGTSIWVVVFLLSFLIFLFVILEAIFVTASVVFLRASCGVGFVCVFEVEIAAKFGRLRLSQVWLWVYATGCGFVEPAARKNVRWISAEGSVGCFSAASALKVKRFIEGIVGE